MEDELVMIVEIFMRTRREEVWMKGKMMVEEVAKTGDGGDVDGEGRLGTVTHKVAYWSQQK